MSKAPPPPPSPAGAMLERARALVSGERDRTHGAKELNHANIAALWEGYVRRRFQQWENEHGIGLVLPPNGEPLIRPLDVALMMALLKIARTLAGAPNPDDYIDGAGYFACAFEIAGFTTENVAKP